MEALSKQSQKPELSSSGVNAGCEWLLGLFLIQSCDNESLVGTCWPCSPHCKHDHTERGRALQAHNAACQSQQRSQQSFWDTQSGRHGNLVCLQFSAWRMCDVAIPITLSAKRKGVAMDVRSKALDDGGAGVVLDKPPSSVKLVEIFLW